MGEMPLEIRRWQLMINYWINLQGHGPSHPAKKVLQVCWEHGLGQTVSLGWVGDSWARQLGLWGIEFSPTVAMPQSPVWMWPCPVVDLQLLENAEVTLERLTAAAVEIFGAVENTIVEYQEENERLRRILRNTQETPLCKIDSVQFPLPLSEEEVPREPQNCEQEWNLNLWQEDPEPTQIKEEHEELQTHPEEELEANIIEFKFPTVSVKTECDYGGPFQSIINDQTRAVEKRESDYKSANVPPFSTVTHLKLLDFPFEPPECPNGVSSHSSVLSRDPSLRVFLNERLTAAAVEIFGAVENTIVEYQEENERLRRMLRSTQETPLCKIDLCGSEEEVLSEQQHCEQEWNPSLWPEDHEPTQIKEEQEELRTNQKVLQDLNSLNSVSGYSLVRSSDPEGFDCSLPLDVPLVDSRNAYSCLYCGETFVLNADLQRHVALSKKSPSECHFCRKLYDSTCKLKAHVRHCQVSRVFSLPLGVWLLISHYGHVKTPGEP
ncbi:hypothetical protein DPEC_G00099940 [Dallia pectoralis]|uniref:Uncharacterized protein n=1 Tax=Dallia pectoralis TaxID=75939 RepID=A0ACC2GWT7_DALPE|nr:hypothetical protein DPEC_G00099940 [Dallia pectoralis]